MIVYATFRWVCLLIFQKLSQIQYNTFTVSAWFLGCFLGCVWPHHGLSPRWCHRQTWISKTPGFEDIPEAYAAALHGHHEAQKVTRFSQYQGLSWKSSRSQHEIVFTGRPLTSTFNISPTHPQKSHRSLVDILRFFHSCCWKPMMIDRGHMKPTQRMQCYG